MFETTTQRENLPQIIAIAQMVELERLSLKGYLASPFFTELNQVRNEQMLGFREKGDYASNVGFWHWKVCEFLNSTFQSYPPAEG